MSLGKKFLIILVAGSLGIWGCAQNQSANAERIRALENKIARLEEDFKASVAVREQLRKRLTAVEEERTLLAQQVEQLQIVVKERDDLKVQLTQRTNERDTAQAQFDTLRKGLKTLLGQIEAPPSAHSQPISSTFAVPAPGKS
jgi:septal ring factor EnvC (AmiA/AmiB activator)